MDEKTDFLQFTQYWMPILRRRGRYPVPIILTEGEDGFWLQNAEFLMWVCSSYSVNSQKGGYLVTSETLISKSLAWRCLQVPEKESLTPILMIAYLRELHFLWSKKEFDDYPIYPPIKDLTRFWGNFLARTTGKREFFRTEIARFMATSTEALSEGSAYRLLTGVSQRNYSLAGLWTAHFAKRMEWEDLNRSSKFSPSDQNWKQRKMA